MFLSSSKAFQLSTPLETTVNIVHKLSQKATKLQGYRCHLTEKDCNEIIEFEQNNRSIQNHFTLFQVCMNMCPERMVKRVCDQLLTLRIAFIVKLVTLKTIARISIGCALRAVVDQLTTECKPDLLNIYERLNKFAQSDSAQCIWKMFKNVLT